MHIPDGFLSAPVWATLGAVSLPAVGYMARRAQDGMEESRVPLLGVMGAFVFAAQMVNFSVGVGTSGHLLGSTLLAVTLGPAAASVVMTAILAIQALLFQDGGVLALGANVFNMALCGVLVGYLPYKYWGADAGWRRSAAIFLGAVLSVLVGAALAICQLMVSGVAIRPALLGLALLVFAVSAVLEGAITVAVTGSIETLNPAWVRRPETASRKAILALAAAALLLVLAGVWYASADPDGLEKVSEQAGIADRARTLLGTPFADYETQFLSSPWLRKASAGLLGLAVIYCLCLLFARLIRPRSA